MRKMIFGGVMMLIAGVLTNANAMVWFSWWVVTIVGVWAIPDRRKVK